MSRSQNLTLRTCQHVSGCLKRLNVLFNHMFIKHMRPLNCSTETIPWTYCEWCRNPIQKETDRVYLWYNGTFMVIGYNETATALCYTWNSQDRWANQKAPYGRPPIISRKTGIDTKCDAGQPSLTVHSEDWTHDLRSTDRLIYHWTTDNSLFQVTH